MNARMTCQQILEATQRLIETGGLVRFGTTEMAYEAEDATILWEYKRKEDLCLTLVLENSPKFKAAILQKRPGRHSVTYRKVAPRLSQARHRQAMRHGRKGPKEVLDLLVGYIDAEQRLGRINACVDPLSAAALLFGPCFHWAFVRHGMDRNVLPMKDKEFVVDLVATLMQ